MAARRLPYGLLLWCADKFEGASASELVGRGVRNLYRGPLKNFIHQKMNAVEGAALSVEVVSRHSVETRDFFNPFFSDADFTLVVTGRLTLRRTDALLDECQRLRRYLPMIGEVEIFSASEWNLRSGLWNEHESLFQLLRDFKKIRWMEWKLEPGLHPYHRTKVTKAIRKTLHKYQDRLPLAHNLPDIDNHRFLIEGFAARLKSLVSYKECASALAAHDFKTVPATIYSREFDVTFETERWEPAVLACLLALVPSHDDDHPSMREPVRILRNLPNFRVLHTAVLKNEILYANASPRVHRQFRGTSWQWTENLLGQLRRLTSNGDFMSTSAALNGHRHEVAPSTL